MKLVVFDVDGTLVDSQHAIVAAMEHAFTRNGLTPPPAPATRRIIGLSLTEAVARLLPETELERLEIVARDYGEAFRAIRHDPRHQEPLFPGARAGIERLAEAGVLLGIATGKSRRGVASFFEQHGLQSYFVSVQTADDHPSKPHPAMLRQAMADLGTEPEHTTMVGDTVYDMEMARAAHTSAIGVGWGYHPVAELTSAGAQAVVDRFEDLVDGLLHK